MRLVAFDKSGMPALAVKRGDDLVDLSAAAPDLPETLDRLLAGGPDALAEAAAAAGRAGADAVLADPVTRVAPVTASNKVLCIGLNYKDHAAENDLPPPDFPVVFSRYPDSLVGDGQPILRPRHSTQLDFEAELTVVIGKTARNVSAADALDHVAGYIAMNEGSIRDYQLRASQWLLGKSFDGSGSLGPEFVTADELPPGAAGLEIMTRLNGEEVQHSNTGELFYDVATIVATITEAMTLRPGDCIATGTPAGIGLFRKPPLFMKHGDVCEVEIEGIGVLTNPIADEA